MHASRTNRERVSPRVAAALSMLAVSSSGNQKDTTRPVMRRHNRLLALGISTLVLAACGRTGTHEGPEDQWWTTGTAPSGRQVECITVSQKGPDTFQCWEITP